MVHLKIEVTGCIFNLLLELEVISETIIYSLSEPMESHFENSRLECFSRISFPYVMITSLFPERDTSCNLFPGFRCFGKNFTAIAEILGTKTEMDVRNFLYDSHGDYQLRLTEALQEFDQRRNNSTRLVNIVIFVYCHFVRLLGLDL